MVTYPITKAMRVATISWAPLAFESLARGRECVGEAEQSGRGDRGDRQQERVASGGLTGETEEQACADGAAGA